MEIQEIEFAFEGEAYVAQVKTYDHDSDDGPKHLWSFDGGKSFHPTKDSAFVAAQRQGLLVKRQPDNPEGFEGFTIALLQQLQELKPGESLRICRDEHNFAVLKENLVLAAKVSTLGDVDLRVIHEGEGS